MKTNIIKHILSTVACVCLPVTASLAQGNLINFNNWIVQSQGGVVSLIPAMPPDSGYIEFKYDGGSISQQIQTTPGAYYLLALSAIQFSGTNSAFINIDGGLLANLNFKTPAQSPVGNQIPGYKYNTVWDSFSYTFQAVFSYTTLSFSYYPQTVGVPSNPGIDRYYGSGAFDAISVTQVPEPSSATLLGGGLVGGLAYYRRRRFKLKNRL